MRKHQLAKALKLLDTLSEANAKCMHLLACKDWVTAIKLLGECHEFANQIGSFIHGAEDEGMKTASRMEEYAQCLKKAMGEIGQVGDDKDCVLKLSLLLKEIRDDMLHKFEQTKMEVVFLPCKASMWDSLESIWFAASSDPDCNTHVVPIPYFDRLPNGGMGQMHEESNQYPGYAPITKWQTFAIEDVRPDIIFFHIPYDEINAVTSVHPLFYSKRLKKYTDLLAYVPYFVSVDEVQESFCYTPGILHADKVFLQSERIREVYVQVFKRYVQFNHLQKKYGIPEEKFIALGSPKFDKAVHLRREDHVIPKAWEDQMTDCDGKRKCTILFNSAIQAALQFPKDFLVKLGYVLRAFQKRSDVTLWWRPHPLLETVYESMMPDLHDEYLHIVVDFRSARFGIFDDTTDMSRAIACCDAYYGDLSSLVALCMAAGKPAMVQDVRLTEVDGGFSLPITACDQLKDIYRKHFLDVAVGNDFQQLSHLKETEIPQLDCYLDSLTAWHKKTAKGCIETISSSQTEAAKVECSAGQRIFDYCKSVVIDGLSHRE